MPLPYTLHPPPHRWGNAAPPSHPTAVELTWRPSVPTAPATHGAQRPVLCSGHVDPADGSFALPGYPLSGANLPEHVDLDLVLRLVGQGQQQGGGEALEQPGALGAVPQLMLQRVYVASRELSALRAELESINKEVRCMSCAQRRYAYSASTQVYCVSPHATLVH